MSTLQFIGGLLMLVCSAAAMAQTAQPIKRSSLCNMQSMHIIPKNVAGCRFEYSINAPVGNAGTLSGDWKGESGRYIIRDLHDGRVRILAKFKNGGIILDGHIVRFAETDFLQALILARLDTNQKILAMPKSRWLIWRYEKKGNELVLQELKPVNDPNSDYDSFTEAVNLALKRGDAFEKRQQVRRIGGAEPANL